MKTRPGGSNYVTCSRCGERHHVSEPCYCVPCRECGVLVAAQQHWHEDDVVCNQCEKSIDAYYEAKRVAETEEEEEADVGDKCKELCVGCRNDFYNGKNPMGVKECWMFKTARMVTRTRVGIWQEPPYQWQPQVTLSCHQSNDSAWIDSNDARIELAKEDDHG